jgi:hypothetical protein
LRFVKRDFLARCADGGVASGAELIHQSVGLLRPDFP